MNENELKYAKKRDGCVSLNRVAFSFYFVQGLHVVVVVGVRQATLRPACLPPRVVRRLLNNKNLVLSHSHDVLK